MDEQFHGRCDHCWTKVASCHYAFSRHIELCVYPLADIPNAKTIYAEVLHAEELTRYCCAECADVGAYCQMEDRGVILANVGIGPISACSKCGQLMDLRKPHIAYEMMNQTELVRAWLTSVEPHDSTTLARLCIDFNPVKTTEASTTDVDNLTELATASD